MALPLIAAGLISAFRTPLGRIVAGIAIKKVAKKYGPRIVNNIKKMPRGNTIKQNKTFNEGGW
jgi:hypothetical protein